MNYSMLVLPTETFFRYNNSETMPPKRKAKNEGGGGKSAKRLKKLEIPKGVKIAQVTTRDEDGPTQLSTVCPVCSCHIIL